jgi:hypothetical protein
MPEPEWTPDHTRAVLRDGPLDGQRVEMPALTIAIIVWHGGGFHRYRRKPGEVGQDSPLVYDGPVSPEAAGFGGSGS